MQMFVKKVKNKLNKINYYYINYRRKINSRNNFR